MPPKAAAVVRSTPVSSGVLRTIPDFVNEINKDYVSQISHVFILHGNIYDYVDNGGNDDTIKKVLSSCYDDDIIAVNARNIPGDNVETGIQSTVLKSSKKTKIIAFYNSSLGLEFPSNKSFNVWKSTLLADMSADEKEIAEAQGDRYFLPVDSGTALSMFNRWFELSKKVQAENQISISMGETTPRNLKPEAMLTLVITDSDTLFPAGNVSQLGGDRGPIVFMRNWAQDKKLGDRNKLILMTRHLSDIHDSIRGELAVSHLVRKPNLSDRLEYITNYDRNIRKRAEDSGNTLTLNNIIINQINLSPDFTIQEFAVQSAGMNRRQIKDVIYNSWRNATPIDFPLVRERKKRALDDEYDGMIDIKEPSFGFDQIGGHEHFKDYCRWEIIKPLKEGDRKLCSRGALMTGPPGCQPAGSKVLMADGSWKDVKDIIVGDKVISPQHDNTSIISTVTETVIYKDRDIYEVASKDEQKKYKCADNHIIPFLRSKQKKIDGKKTRHYDLVELQAAEIATKGVHSRDVIFTTPAFDFVEKEYKIHPYLLGAMLGNGGFTYNLSFTGSRKMLDKLKSLGVIFGKSEYPKGNSFSVYLVGETSKLFRQTKLWGKNSYNKFIPEEYKLGSISQRLELLAGLIDTDGSKDSYTSCSEQLARDFMDLVHSVGGYSSITSRITYDQNNTPCKSYRVHYSFVEHLPNLVNKHKVQATKDLSKDNVHRRNPRNLNFTVTKIGNEDVYGFVLDSPSEWYVGDDYLVLHNTGKSMIAWALAKEAGLNFIQVDLGRVFGGLVGQTETNMRKLIEAIEAASPCIVFIDEIDSVLSSGRTSVGDSGTSARVFNSFMTWLSDPGRVGKVVVLAASNRPELLDAALIRAGRLDVKIPMLPPSPTNRAGKMEILAALTLKHKIILSKELLEPTGKLGSIDANKGLGLLLCDTTRIWTGAEIEQLLQAAFRKAARAERKTKEGKRDLTVTVQDWEDASASIIPNTKQVERMVKLALYFVDNLDYLPQEWRAQAANKDQLADELGLIPS